VKQKLDNVLEAAAQLRDDSSTAFCLVGGGTDKEHLQEFAASRGLPNVKFLPLEPKELLPGMLAAANVLLVNQSAQVVDMVIPSKLVTYMAAGRAVVAAVEASSEVARAIERAACGLVVPPEDPAALAAAISRLKSDQEMAARFGRAGRRFAEKHFDRELLLARFEDELVSVLPNSTGEENRLPEFAGVTRLARQIRK
jgi:colanic acid biosynthesis glycosyl transferase WcaI